MVQKNICKQCKKEFIPNHFSFQKYCNNKCKRVRDNYERKKIKDRPNETRCKYCNKLIEVKRVGLVPKYCSSNCCGKFNYPKNRIKIIEYQKKYKKEDYKNNKEKYRERQRKWRKENLKKVCEYAKMQRERDPLKHKSRDTTCWILKGAKKKKVFLEKECKSCGSIDNLQIHHEIYPVILKEIIQAIKDGKIYYLCLNCHTKVENGKRNK